MAASETIEDYAALDLDQSVRFHFDQGHKWGSSEERFGHMDDEEIRLSAAISNNVESVLVETQPHAAKPKKSKVNRHGSSIRWSDMVLVHEDESKSDAEIVPILSGDGDIDEEDEEGEFEFRREDSSNFNDSFMNVRSQRKRLSGPRNQQKLNKKQNTQQHRHEDREMFQSALSSESSKSNKALDSMFSKSRDAYHGALKTKRSVLEMVHPLEKHAMNVKPLQTILKKLPSKSFVNEFDYAIVFPYSEEDEAGQSSDAKYIMHSMLLAGLELFPYASASKESLYVLVRCPFKKLKAIAEASGMKLLADENGLRNILYRGKPDKRIARVRILHEPTITPIHPYKYVYLKYQQENDPRLYATNPYIFLSPSAIPDPMQRNSTFLSLFNYLSITPSWRSNKNNNNHNMNGKHSHNSFRAVSSPSLLTANACVELNLDDEDIDIETGSERNLPQRNESVISYALKSLSPTKQQPSSPRQSPTPQLPAIYPMYHSQKAAVDAASQALMKERNSLVEDTNTMLPSKLPIPVGDTNIDNYLFSKLLRLKLIHHLLTSPKRIGGCNLELTRLIHHQIIEHYFPLHDTDIRQYILTQCVSVLTFPWQLPFQTFKEYFGEKIALFMIFIGYLSYHILPLSLIGVIFQVIIWHSDNFSHPLACFYTLATILWSMVILYYWKRKESVTAMKWGMSDYVSQQNERPEFIGELQIHSYINGKEMLYFPKNDFRERSLLSLMAIGTFISLVLGVIVAIYILRFSLNSSLGQLINGIAAILNVTQILVLNVVYQSIAISLTQQENHRTETEYEDALVIKIFVFQFINSYASLFFLAYIAAYLPNTSTMETDADHRGQCGDVDCMRPLAINVGIIMAARMIFKNLLELMIPYGYYLYSIYLKSSALSKIDTSLSPPELDSMLMKYDSTLEHIKKYADIAIQYGYTTLFIAALPSATFITFISLYLKCKVKTWKLLMLYQRPIPVGAQSIESWQSIFHFISILSVITNAAIITFTMDILSSYSNYTRLWIFVVAQWCLACCQYLAYALIPGEPEQVAIQKARINFITQKVVDKFEDDDFDTQYYDWDSEDEDDDEGDANEEKNEKKSSDRLPLIHPSMKHPPKTIATTVSEVMAGHLGGDYRNDSEGMIPLPPSILKHSPDISDTRKHIDNAAATIPSSPNNEDVWNDHTSSSPVTTPSTPPSATTGPVVVQGTFPRPAPLIIASSSPPSPPSFLLPHPAAAITKQSSEEAKHNSQQQRSSIRRPPPINTLLINSNTGSANSTTSGTGGHGSLQHNKQHGKKLPRVELSQLHGSSMLFGGTSAPMQVMNMNQKVSITPRHFQPNAATSSFPVRTPTNAGGAGGGIRSTMVGGGNASPGIPTGPTIIHQIASPRNHHHTTTTTTTNTTLTSPTYITRKVNVWSGDDVISSSGNSIISGASSSNPSSPMNNHNHNTNNTVSSPKMMQSTVTSADGKSIYLKRVSHGFYLHEEKITWYGYFGQWWQSMSHSIRNTIPSPRHAHSPAAGGNTGNTNATSMHIPADGGIIPPSSTGTTSRSTHHLNQSNVSMRTNLTTHSGKKQRVYQQRVEYNQDSGILKLAPLDIYTYPYTENVNDWQSPISVDGISNDSNMNLLKWF